MHGAWKRNIWLTASLSCSTRLVGGWSVLYNNLSIYWNTNDSVLARTLRSFKCMHSKRSHVYNYQAHQDPTHLSFLPPNIAAAVCDSVCEMLDPNNAGIKRNNTLQFCFWVLQDPKSGQYTQVQRWSYACILYIYIWLLFMLQIIYIYIYIFICYDINDYIRY